MGKRGWSPIQAEPAMRPDWMEFSFSFKFKATVNRSLRYLKGIVVMIIILLLNTLLHGAETLNNNINNFAKNSKYQAMFVLGMMPKRLAKNLKLF